MAEQVKVKVTYVIGNEQQVIKGLTEIIDELVDRIDDNAFVFDNFDNSNRCKHCRSKYPDHKDDCTIIELKQRIANIVL